MKTLDPLHLRHPDFEERTRALREAGILSDAEIFVVDAVAERFGESHRDVLLGLSLALRAPRGGHVGVDLRRVEELLVPDGGLPPDEENEPFSLDWPSPADEWECQVLRSPMVSASDDEPPSPRPFVSQRVDDATLVMTRRLWWEQQRLADGLRGLCASPPELAVTADEVERGIAALGIEGRVTQAIRTAAAQRLTVVTGGPGTGKTFSIKSLLALLLHAYPPSAARPLRVELAAPTGKAAVRMGEAMGEALDAVAEATSQEVQKALLALEPRTLHKLLGVRPDGTSRHGPDNPVAADVVVVDEVSMADLVLMRRLVEAIPPGARLILLGDRDQLASVDAGSVLSDVVSDAIDGGARGALTDAVVHLDVPPHRFEKGSRVLRIATLLQSRGNESVDEACRLMAPESPAREEPTGRRLSDDQLEALADPYRDEEGYAGKLAALLAPSGPSRSVLADPETHLSLLAALDRYRVLAVHRRSPLGVSGLEREVSRRVRERLEAAIGEERTLPRRSGFWLGQALLVTENAYDVGLMNGDIGLVLPGSDGKLAAVFPVKRAGESCTREVALARLPAHQGALVMTVHKSQGSQFHRVALVLAGRPSPIQTREIVYTGVTRAKSELVVYGGPEELAEALRRRVRRASGLAELLR